MLGLVKTDSNDVRHRWPTGRLGKYREKIECKESEIAR